MAKTYGKWMLGESLGEGGQAHAFVATTAGDSAKYALKRLKNLSRVGRFVREMEAIRKLDHPGILKLIDCDPSGDHPYLVTPLYPAGTLAASDLASWGVDRSLSFFRQLCDAVAHAHKHGVVHRDIKPANILLNDTGDPILADFGICFVDDDGKRFTAVDEAVGASGFIAPEAEDGRQDTVEAASDVYSLGKILYYLVSGGKRLPREKHREGPHDLLKLSGEPDLELVYQLLDVAITPDPSSRAADAGHLLKAVRSVQERRAKRPHWVGITVPQHCDFCALGNYRVLVDPRSESYASELRAIFPIGNAAISGDHGAPSRWLVLGCTECGHVQWFRPTAVNGRNRWY